MERLPDEILSNIFSIACHSSEVESAGLPVESGYQLELSRFSIRPHGLKGCGPNFPPVSKKWNAVVENDSRLWKTVCQWLPTFAMTSDIEILSEKESYVSKIKEGIFRHGVSDIDIYLNFQSIPQLWDVLAPFSNRWRNFQVVLPDDLSPNLLPSSLDLRYSKLENLILTVFNSTHAQAIRSILLAKASPENPVLFPRLRELRFGGYPINISPFLSCVSLDSLVNFKLVVGYDPGQSEEEVTNDALMPPIQFRNLDTLHLDCSNRRTACFLSRITAPKLRFMRISLRPTFEEKIRMPSVVPLPSLEEFHLSTLTPANHGIDAAIETILSHLHVPNLQTVRFTTAKVLSGIRTSQDPGVTKFLQNVKKFIFTGCDGNSPHLGRDSHATFQKLVNVEDVILDIPPSPQNPIFKSLSGVFLEHQETAQNAQLVQLPAPEMAKWKTLRIGGEYMLDSQFHTLVEVLEYRRNSFGWRLERLEMMGGEMTASQRRKLSALVNVVIDASDANQGRASSRSRVEGA